MGVVGRSGTGLDGEGGRGKVVRRMRWDGLGRFEDRGCR